MTLSDIERTAELFVAAGRRTIPVPIAEWRVLQMSKNDEKIRDVVRGAVSSMGLRRLMQDENALDRSPDYWAGYRDGLADANVLFGQGVDMATRIGAVDKKALAKGKIKPIDKTPKPLRGAKHRKAARIEKGLRANRKGKA